MEEIKAPEKVQEKTKPSPKVTVRTVAVLDKKALVEWQTKSGSRRVIVPEAKVQGNECTQDVLDAGKPYGVPWSEVLKVPEYDIVELARTLYEHGIWTMDDIDRRHTQVEKSIRAALKFSSADVRRAAKKYEKENG